MVVFAVVPTAKGCAAILAPEVNARGSAAEVNAVVPAAGGNAAEVNAAAVPTSAVIAVVPPDLAPADCLPDLRTLLDA